MKIKKIRETIGEPLSAKQASVIIRKEFGRRNARLIHHIEPVPWRADSMGTVFKAVLSDGNRALISVSLNPVVDLRMAAGRAEILAAQFENQGMIEIPRVVWSHTSPRVLTQIWRPAVPLAEAIHAGRTGLALKKELARALVCALVYQYGAGGHFFLDPEPREWYLTRSGKLTAGNFQDIGYLEPEIRKTALGLILAAAAANGESAMAKLLLGLHYSRGGHKENKEAGLLPKSIKEKTAPSRLREILRQAEVGGLSVPVGIIQVFESLSALEKTGRALIGEAGFNALLKEAAKNELKKSYGINKNTTLSALATKTMPG